MTATVATTEARPRRPVFGAVAEEAMRRRPSDWVRLTVATVLVAALSASATTPSSADVALLNLVQTLPAGLRPVFTTLWDVGALWALGLVVAAAVVGRRWRLARDLLVAGLLGWGAARVVGSVVVGHAGLRAGLQTLTHRGTTPPFPLVRLSLLVAVAVAAGPYIGRPVRRWGAVLVGAVAVSSVFLGYAFPTDVLGGLLLGWGAAAAVHLAVGSPGRRPSSRQLAALLPTIGIRATDIALAAAQPSDATLFVCTDAEGPLRVKVIGRDEVDAQLLAKVWRFLVYKEPAPALYVTRAQQVEHEACMALLARAAGVRVPEILFVGKAGPKAALLVARGQRGADLSDLSEHELTDALLEATWREVATLHRVHLTHGALDAAHVVVADERPTLVGFAHASTGGFGLRRVRDIAQLLAATTALVGAQRAVAACVDVLGTPALVDTIPILQPSILLRHTRSAFGDRRHERLDELRATAARAAGVEPPALSQLQRVRGSSVLMAVSALVAVGVLLNQVGNPEYVWDATQHAAGGWVIVALAASLATNVAYAVALMGTLPLPLPLWITSELQFGMSYANLAIPVIGGTGLQIRFLQRQGAELPAAVAAGGLLATAGGVISQIPLLAAAIALSPDTLRLGGVPVGGIVKTVAVALVAIGAVGAVAFGVPRLRHAVVPPMRGAAATIWTALRSPRQLAMMLGGNALVSLLYGACLFACLRAFGGSLSYWTLLAVSLAVGTLASLVPIPGGSTAVGSVGVAGALTSLGVPTHIAVAATLTNQVTVNYLPAMPGWVATRHLLRHDYL